MKGHMHHHFQSTLISSVQIPLKRHMSEVLFALLQAECLKGSLLPSSALLAGV